MYLLKYEYFKRFVYMNDNTFCFFTNSDRYLLQMCIGREIGTSVHFFPSQNANVLFNSPKLRSISHLAPSVRIR